MEKTFHNQCFRLSSHGHFVLASEPGQPTTLTKHATCPWSTFCFSSLISEEHSKNVVDSHFEKSTELTTEIFHKPDEKLTLLRDLLL